VGDIAQKAVGFYRPTIHRLIWLEPKVPRRASAPVRPNIIRARRWGAERAIDQRRAGCRQDTPAAQDQGAGKSFGGQALNGECYVQGSAPYAPIAEIIREIDLSGLPPLVLADLLTLAPDLCSRYPDVPPNSPLDPQAEQQRLFESVVALCAALTARAPLRTG
jgi:hypothetical protein